MMHQVIQMANYGTAGGINAATTGSLASPDNGCVGFVLRTGFQTEQVSEYTAKTYSIIISLPPIAGQAAGNHHEQYDASHRQQLRVAGCHWISPHLCRGRVCLRLDQQFASLQHAILLLKR